MGGFVREGSSDDYVLLGGGGHKLLSEIRGTVYDAEIEYLESTSTQWIDTLYKPNNNTRIICDFQFTQSNDWSRIFGCSESSKWNTVPTFQLDFEDGVTTGKLGIIIGNNTGWTRLDIAGDFNRHTYDLTTTRLIYDGTQVATLSDQTFQCTADLAIFTRRPGNTTPSQSNSAYGKLYSFQIYESDELVRDFIPVRIGQVGYLYDRVSKQLFGNAGTDDFILGPDQYYLPLTGGTLTGHVGATGFIKSDSSDSYVLLGGGGHKLESDLSVGYAGSTRVATILGNIDNRNTDNLPSYYYANSLGGAGAVSSELAYTGSAHGWNETRITTVPWWDTSGGRPVQLALADSGAYLRTAASRTQWNQWQTIITSANIGNYIRNIYDAEIEYIESTGTQWINTLYKPNNNTRIICDFQYTQSNNYPRIFGCSTGTKYNDVPTVQLDFETGVTTGKLHFMIGNDADWTITDIAGDFNRHTYDFNTTRLIYDGTQVATYPDQTFQLTTNLAIFTKVGPNYNPYTGEYASGKLYSFQIYESNELVRDFIPVRVGNIGYLYDKVSCKLFGNSGGGDFVLGQDTGPGGGMTYIPTIGGINEGWIGTASPSYKLHVNGDVSATGFIKEDSSDSYVLLGGGGHKLLSEIGGSGGTLYDAEIEYLESTGTQYIDTGIVPSTPIDSMYVKISNTSSASQNGFCGVLDGYGSNDFGIRCHWYAGYYGPTNSRVIIPGNNPKEGWAVWSLSNQSRTLLFEGVTTVNSSVITEERTYSGPIWLFGCNGTGTGGKALSPCKIASFQFYRNDVLIMDLIPVRVGTTGYMYDKVSGRLFGNSGTGDFVLGPDQYYLPLTGGTITGNLSVNGSRCFLCNTTHPDAHVNISDSAQIVKTNESYNPYLLFHIPNINWGRIEYSSDNKFHFKNGESNTTYVPLYAASFNQGSDIRKKNIGDNVNVNIYDIANAPLFKFTWKDESKYSGLHVGSSAQYWQTILPELTAVANDSDQTLSMQYDVISLVSSIIVAKKTVENEQKISYLESQLTQLRNEILNLKISDSN